MHTEQHVLDNPVWYAMISGNKALAQGTDAAKIFPKEVSPIAGLQAYTTAHFNALYDITSFDRPALIFAVNEVVIPDGWNVLLRLSGFQMVYAGASLPPMPKEEYIVALQDNDVPQMLALTQLTNPGPFASRTIDFGGYEGIFNAGELVAMAGQRLYPYNYVEISAVCTHPAHTGKGYARGLILRQMHHIVAAGNTPFLHVKDDNHRAINVYENLGFEIRTKVLFFVLQKKR